MIPEQYQMLPMNAWTSAIEKMLKTAGKDESRIVEQLVTAASLGCYDSIHTQVRWDDKDTGIRTILDWFTSCGWGKFNVENLSPGVKLVLKCEHYFESEIQDRFREKRNFAISIRGLGEAIMDYCYGSPYPAGSGSFTSSQSEIDDTVIISVVRR